MEGGEEREVEEEASILQIDEKILSGERLID